MGGICEVILPSWCNLCDDNKQCGSDSSCEDGVCKCIDSDKTCFGGDSTGTGAGCHYVEIIEEQSVCDEKCGYFKKRDDDFVREYSCADDLTCKAKSCACPADKTCSEGVCVL